MSEMLLEQDRINRERLCSRDFNVNFLVSAGAGAGKTFTTVERVFNMLNDPSTGIRPQDIVMITFTVKAATEMKTRLSAKVRAELEKASDPERKAYLSWLMDRLPEMQISTIHSFCKRILNDYPLESGVGFAPRYESEDGEGNGPLEIWFDKAWKGGRCPECQRIGVSQEMALKLMSTFNQFPTAEPQYLSPSVPEYAEKFAGMLAECRRMVRAFGDSLGETKPDLFVYRIRNALLAGDDLTDADAIRAARKIAKDGPGVAEWMGKTPAKTAAKACEALRAFLDIGEDSEEALQRMQQVLDIGNAAKGDERRRRIVDAIPMLPEGYREAAGMAETLPDKEVLKALCDDIDLMIHSVVTEEIYKLNQEYVRERQENHIVTLSDMLLRSAQLVKNYPDVRRKLHEQYRVFFVDEYQDTNPVQTELIFGIAADRYDPDWHKCVPGPGRLFLVGDAKQGIYRFTGADIALWKEAEEVIRSTGGEVIELSKNYRSTTEICDAVTESFDHGKLLGMDDTDYQVEYREMTAHRGSGPEAIFHHIIPVIEEGAAAEDGQEIDSYAVTAEQVAQFILRRVAQGNRFGDFLILSFFREKHSEYTEAFRKYRIPVKFDGLLDLSDYRPVVLLNLRVQAVMHPFDERLSFRALCECGEVTPQEWDLFRMNVKKLPEETRLTRFRTVRDLMGHTEELGTLLPPTPMNRNILRALKMLDDDRKLSQRRNPIAFLDEVVEMSDGLFRDEYDAEEYQNQYAALRHIIDRIRESNPQQFTDMAELLNVIATSQLDRMPTLRTDDNFVRLMNLHKAKGLQGKIMIFLPGTAKRITADHYIERDGTETRGWFVLSTPGGGVSYNPPEWKEKAEKEKEFLKAERTRLRYVALTRAEDEAHFFEFMKDEGKRQTKEYAWKGFEGIGSLAKDPDPLAAVTEAEEEAAAEEAPKKAGRQEQFELMAGKPAVRVRKSRRVTPSDQDRRVENEPVLLIQDADGEEDPDPLAMPGGKSWGSAVHRAAELIVKDGTFTQEAIALAAKQAAAEEFRSELLRKKERENLQLPEEAVTLEEIRNRLAERITERLAFMTDGSSPFRKLIEGAEIHTEMPFVISVSQDDGDVYLKLASRTDEKQGKRLEISGKIDLALRYPDGTWAIADYKTDRMKPEDMGNRDAFYARLNLEYGNQLEIYKTVLEYLTGETVRETKILTV